MLESKYIKGLEKSLFIFDLLLCSVWGLFMFSEWSFSLRAVMVPVLLVLMRLILSFLVYKRVGYGLFSAICFAIVLLFYEHRSFVLALPIIKMVDFPSLIFGSSELDSFFAEYYYTPNKEIGTLIADIGFAWLVGYPILFGLYALLKIESFKFRMMPGWKAVIKYVIVVSMYAYFYEFVREPSSPPDWWVWTLLMSLIPLIVERHRYKGCPNSFIPIWRDRTMKQYCLLAFVIFTAFLIGRENPGYLGLVGVIALPLLLLYVVLHFSGEQLHSKDAWILVFGAIMYWWAPFFDNECKMILLVINLCCITYVCFLKGLHWKTLLFVPIAIIVFIQPCCIGYNLYAATHVGMRAKYRDYAPAIKGLWLVDCGSDKLGLRDRYGMILNADYEDIQQLQPTKPFIKVQKGGKWGVYDIEQHKMEIEPTYTNIVQKGKYTFLLEDTLNIENNKYLTMFVHYYRYQAITNKFYALTDTIPAEPLAYVWPEDW